MGKPRKYDPNDPTDPYEKFLDHVRWVGAQDEPNVKYNSHQGEETKYEHPWTLDSGAAVVVINPDGPGRVWLTAEDLRSMILALKEA